MENSKRVEIVKAYLKTKPNQPCDTYDIFSATGVRKGRIDYQLSLSSDPEIIREKRYHEKSGKYRIFWMYVAPDYQPEALVEPEICFATWRPWSERSALKCDRKDLHGGVYFLAQFEAPPAPDESPWPQIPKEVIYVGCSKNLNNRPLTSHNRTDRYREHFEDDHSLENLYVSVCPIYKSGCSDEKLRYSLIEYIEYRLVWEYIQKYRKPPLMHYKDTNKRK